MASKYDGLARVILQNVGGRQNIISVTHCITRLRFKLRDEGRADTEALEATDGVVRVIQANGQYQVVIGQMVGDVYDAVLKAGELPGAGAVDADGSGDGAAADGGGRKGVGAVLIDVISGILAPVISLLAAAGIIKGLLALFVFLGWLSTDSGAYQIWYAVGDGFFYFLPVILGYTSARKFGLNEFTGMALGAALVYPAMVSITGGEVLGTVLADTPFAMSYYTTFFGIPVVMPAAGYTSSVIPIILACFFAAKLERALNRAVSDLVKSFITPFVVLAVMAPAAYLVLGPVAAVFCNALALLFQWVFNLPVVGGILGGALVGGFWQVLVIFGFHWSIIPLGIVNLGALGYDLIMPGSFCTPFGQAGALLAVILRTGDRKTRKVAVPAFISCIFGVTEPALYGVNLPKRTPFIIGCAASAVGSAISGAMGAKRYMVGALGLFGLTSYIDPSGAEGLYSVWAVLIATVVAFVLALAAGLILHREPAER